MHSQSSSQLPSGTVSTFFIHDTYWRGSQLLSDTVRKVAKLQSGSQFFSGAVHKRIYPHSDSHRVRISSVYSHAFQEVSPPHPYPTFYLFTLLAQLCIFAEIGRMRLSEGRIAVFVILMCLWWNELSTLLHFKTDLQFMWCLNATKFTRIIPTIQTTLNSLYLWVSLIKN